MSQSQQINRPDASLDVAPTPQNTPLDTAVLANRPANIGKPKVEDIGENDEEEGEEDVGAMNPASLLAKVSALSNRLDSKTLRKSKSPRLWSVTVICRQSGIEESAWSRLFPRLGLFRRSSLHLPHVAPKDLNAQLTLGPKISEYADSVTPQNPALLALAQQKFDQLIGQSSGYIESLPADVRRRIDGLKGVQVEHSKIESEFQMAILELEKKVRFSSSLIGVETDVIVSFWESTVHYMTAV